MHMTERIYTDSDCPCGIFKLFLRICWIVPKKYLLLLDQTILLHFRSSIDRPLNLPHYPGSKKFQYPGRKYMINNWGLMKKKLFWMKWCLFYFYVPTYHRFFTANIASQTSKRHPSACNIWTFSRRFSRNLTPRAPKKYLTVVVFYLF